MNIHKTTGEAILVVLGYNFIRDVYPLGQKHRACNPLPKIKGNTMQIQHMWLMLAPEYDEICIPSMIAEHDKNNDPRKSAKAIRHYISRYNLNFYQRRNNESSNGWTLRLEELFGEFSCHISPPRKVQATNNRYYTGHTALILMFTLPTEEIEDALTLAWILSNLDPKKTYNSQSVFKAWPAPAQDKQRLIQKLEKLERAKEWKTLEQIPGETWIAQIPEGTLKKAKAWLEKNQAVPSFFGTPPDWVQEPNISDSIQPHTPHLKIEPSKASFLILASVAVMIFASLSLWRQTQSAPLEKTSTNLTQQDLNFFVGENPPQSSRTWNKASSAKFFFPGTKAPGTV